MYYDLWFDFQNAMGGKDYRGTGALAPTTFRELGFSYRRIGGVIYKQAKDNLGYFLSAYRTLGGRNTFLSNMISVGVVLKKRPKSKG